MEAQLLKPRISNTFIRNEDCRFIIAVCYSVCWRNINSCSCNVTGNLHFQSWTHGPNYWNECYFGRQPTEYRRNHEDFGLFPLCYPKAYLKAGWLERRLLSIKSKISFFVLILKELLNVLAQASPNSILPIAHYRGLGPFWAKQTMGKLPRGPSWAFIVLKCI